MMAVDGRLLEIVDEKGHAFRTDTRENIHVQGLLHREVHVWMFTPQGEIVFQHRAKDKDTYPDLLDATVGGHVEIGSDFLDTATKELEEETGIRASNESLLHIVTQKSQSYDEVTKKTNNVIRAVYAYRFDGLLSDLKVEQGKALGFEAWPITKLLNISAEDKLRFIPGVFSPEILSIFRKISSFL
ncbi:MAG: NUDIX domain-containing protein [Candidatus Kerfeldbacteria bacterium]|nr:NUDIX domain-containing protein [Candidatus Kerfeldbacteria bacterium]